MDGFRALGRGLLGVAVAAVGVVLAPPTIVDAAPVTFSYTGPVVPIPDAVSNGSSTTTTPVSATVAVSGLANSIDDIDFKIGGSSCNTNPGSTTVGIDHTFTSDLTLTLTSPAGTRITLIRTASLNGGVNFCQVVLDDSGTRSIQQSDTPDAPYTGTWRPHDSLSWLNGEDPNGTWTLTLVDDTPSDTGSLRAFSLVITASPLSLPEGEFRYRGPAVTIPDMFGNTDSPPEIAEAHLPVSGLAGDIDDVDFRIDGTHCVYDENVTTVGIEHNYTTDLVLFLVSPEGTEVQLISRIPVLSNGKNYCQLTLDDSATLGIQGETDPQSLYGATRRPAQPLSAFDDEDPNGTWTLRVETHGATFRESAIRRFSLLIDAPDEPDPSNLAWATPAAITYPTALSSTQLNATATPAGTFVYTPAATTVLGAGTHTLSVTFTPDDDDFATETTTVQLLVNKAASGLTWATPQPITYGTPLSGVQLNASANVAGAYVYNPPLTSVLDVGIHSLTVQFTPTSPNYAVESTSVVLAVGPASSGATWATPAPITYGTPLSSTQLNATAAVDGSFAYTPDAPAVLDAGTHTLSATFTPTSDNYAPATVTTQLLVNQASPGLAWAPPASIPFGTPLSGVQLNATANVPGTFTYLPAAATVLGVGPHTLAVQFTPASSNYAVATATVPIMVVAATTSLTFTQLPEGSGQLAARLLAGTTPLAGQTIVFALAPSTPSGTPDVLCTAVTTASGEARCTLTGPRKLTLSMVGANARNRYVATYAGSTSYVASTATAGGPPPTPPKGKS